MTNSLCTRASQQWCFTIYCVGFSFYALVTNVNNGVCVITHILQILASWWRWSHQSPLHLFKRHRAQFLQEVTASMWWKFPSHSNYSEPKLLPRVCEISHITSLDSRLEYKIAKYCLSQVSFGYVAGTSLGFSWVWVTIEMNLENPSWLWSQKKTWLSFGGKSSRITRCSIHCQLSHSGPAGLAGCVPWPGGSISVVWLEASP